MPVDAQASDVLLKEDYGAWTGFSFEITNANFSAKKNLRRPLEMEKSFEISFHPANEQDEFRLRKIRLALRLAVGSELAPPLDSREYVSLENHSPRSQSGHL
ncbi:MAG: hypothetical protein L0387_34920 [Acidobacteria bacterium]|nr:hypothetical protein [Acidobacteriota bacterium]MCI0724345.1 hypothetical protein [Acidobacteriota bacterium]